MKIVSETGGSSDRNFCALAAVVSIFAVGLDHELFLCAVEGHGENIRLTAHLAILDILLRSSRGLIYCADIPLPAITALKSGRHIKA
jgi:hypothetical protein